MNARVWLLFAIAFLLPFGSLPELPLLIAAVIGVIDARRSRDWLFAQGHGQLVALLFAAYWLPELVSAFDSVAPEKSWLEVAADLRFLPFGWFVLCTLREAPARALILRLGALLLMLWVFDALVQSMFGIGLGGRMQSDRVSGIFSDDNLKLGPVLAALAPLALWAAWSRWAWRGAALAWLVIAAAVLLAGARAAWFGFAVVTLMLLWQIAGSPRGFLRIAAVAAVAGLVVFSASYAISERLQARVDRSLQAFAGTEAALDAALAHRLPIWTTSVRMGSANPVNGVGVRAFRYAYADYAEPGDIWLTTPSGHAMHAHQIVLEVWTETGVFGLLCWLGGFIVALRGWWRADAGARAEALPWAVALVSMTFPINTHLAFYSNFWGMLFWWVLAIFAAMLSTRARSGTPASAIGSN